MSQLDPLPPFKNHTEPCQGKQQFSPKPYGHHALVNKTNKQRKLSLRKPFSQGADWLTEATETDHPISWQTAQKPALLLLPRYILMKGVLRKWIFLLWIFFWIYTAYLSLCQIRWSTHAMHIFRSLCKLVLKTVSQQFFQSYNWAIVKLNLLYQRLAWRKKQPLTSVLNTALTTKVVNQLKHPEFYIVLCNLFLLF